MVISSGMRRRNRTPTGMPTAAADEMRQTARRSIDVRWRATRNSCSSRMMTAMSGTVAWMPNSDTNTEVAIIGRPKPATAWTKQAKATIAAK